MQECCSVHQEVNRPQRRLNGLQLPLNCQQVIGWIVLIVTGALNLLVLVELQLEILKIISLIIFIILYVSHIVSHLSACLLDPSEQELRQMKINTVPEFDRNIHTHVIENGRCHLCNIYTSSKKTKHCSICNKCVASFDHHCKWLNSCVGRRNYVAFLASVVTALALSLMTSSLCFLDIVLVFSDPVYLSPWAQHIIDCSKQNLTHTFEDPKICHNSILLLVFLVMFCTTALAIAITLLHLFCFHVYISALGLSTYEYIMRSGTSSSVLPQYVNKCNCCRIRWSRPLYRVRKSNSGNVAKLQDNSEEEITNVRRLPTTSKTDTTNDTSQTTEKNVARFISILVSNELIKARKMFMHEKNKIHPQEENS